MIDDLRPFSDCKDSGLPWLGDVPAHWEVRRNGRLFRQRNETGFPDLPILEVSLRTGVRVRDFDNSTRKQVMSDREKYKRASHGDIAYNMMRMWQGAVGVAPEDGLISPAYIVAAPLAGTDSRYYEYLFRTDHYKNEVNKFSRGIVSDRNRLYWEDFKQMPSPFPPPEEQAAIVRFLDHADRRIRRYIRAKRRLIELLNEQKQAVIHQAVTRGLDPNVKLKPSGVEWLGDVPEHWRIKKLREIVGVTGGMTPSKAESAFWGGRMPWVSPKDMKVSHLLDSIDHITELALRATNISVVDSPAVLIVVRGMILAKSFPVAVTATPVTINQDMKALLPKHSMCADFLRYCLIGAASHIQTLIEESGHGTRVLRTELWRDIPLAVPDVDERKAIVADLNVQLSRADRAIEQAKSEIELLREYRTRLIADVVTGKLDVGKAAARRLYELDDSTEEIDDLLDDDADDESELDAEPAEVEA